VSTPTSHHPCVVRTVAGYAYRPSSLDDVRRLLLWSAQADIGAATRVAAVQACLWWLYDQQQAYADREAGCVALLREAAVIVGRSVTERST
jgi:hypothetical protein